MVDALTVLRARDVVVRPALRPDATPEEELADAELGRFQRERHVQRRANLRGQDDAATGQRVEREERVVVHRRRHRAGRRRVVGVGVGVGVGAGGFFARRGVSGENGGDGRARSDECDEVGRDFSFWKLS